MNQSAIGVALAIVIAALLITAVCMWKPKPEVEVSADARYIAGRITRTMWIIFVLLPVVFAILYSIGH